MSRLTFIGAVCTMLTLLTVAPQAASAKPVTVNDPKGDVIRLVDATGEETIGKRALDIRSMEARYTSQGNMKATIRFHSLKKGEWANVFVSFNPADLGSGGRYSVDHMSGRTTFLRWSTDGNPVEIDCPVKLKAQPTRKMMTVTVSSQCIPGRQAFSVSATVGYRDYGQGIYWYDEVATRSTFS